MLRRCLARLTRRWRRHEADGERGKGPFVPSRLDASVLFGHGLAGETERELANIEDQARLLDEERRR